MKSPWALRALAYTIHHIGLCSGPPGCGGPSSKTPRVTRLEWVAVLIVPGGEMPLPAGATPRGHYIIMESGVRRLEPAARRAGAQFVQACMQDVCHSDNSPDPRRSFLHIHRPKTNDILSTPRTLRTCSCQTDPITQSQKRRIRGPGSSKGPACQQCQPQH